jgi:hypothetical protein
MRDQQKPKPAPPSPEGQKRGPGRPPREPSPWEPLNVSPEALAQAVLRSPKPKPKPKE